MELKETQLNNTIVTAIAYKNWNEKIEYRIRVTIPNSKDAPIYIKIGQQNYDNLVNLNNQKNEKDNAQGGATKK